MKDRLAQLQAAAAQHAEEEAQAATAAAEAAGGAVNHVVNFHEDDEDDLGPDAPPNYQQSFMADFFEQVATIRSMIDGISERLSELKFKHAEIFESPQVDEDIHEEIDQIMFEIRQDANKIRTKLKIVEKSLADEDEAKKTSADYRIRKTQYTTMHRKLTDVLQEYNDLQLNFRAKTKSKLKRHLEIAKKEKTDEEIDDMIDNGETQAFQQGIMSDTAAAQQMLSDVKARHEHLKKLEASVKELFEMFMDMSTLVEAQGEMIDRIEYNINQTAEFVEEGAKETGEALRMKRSTRKKKCICWTCFAVAILVAIIIVIVVVVVNVCGNGACAGSGDSGDGGTTNSVPPDDGPSTLINPDTLRSLISARTTTTAAMRA